MAEESRDFRVFHVGSQFKHHELANVEITRSDGQPRMQFRFVYGSCPSYGNSCTGAYEVEDADACVVNARSIAPNASSRIHVRGVPAHVIDSDEPPVYLYVYTGRTTIQIKAPSLRSARRAARALRSADGKIGTREPLRSPTPAAMSGQARCRLPRPFEVSMSARGPVFSDGVRWAAWLGADGSEAMVFDERADRIQGFASRAGCERVAAVGADRLLRVCGQDASTYSLPDMDLVHLPTGAHEEMSRPSQDGCSGGDSNEPRAVGSQWVKVVSRGYHWTGWCFFNWRSGTVEYDSQQPQPQDVPDLDEPELRSQLCTPLRRRTNPNPDPYDTQPLFFDYSFDGTFGLTSGRDRRYESARPGRLLLDQCGRRRPQVLSRCWDGCWMPTLGGDLVTWSEYDEVWVVDLRRMRRYRWQLPARYSGYVTVVHTRTRVILSISDDDGSYAVAIAQVPGR
jgi:hypothetical protein